jgi:hypothetical protein
VEPEDLDAFFEESASTHGPLSDVANSKAVATGDVAAKPERKDEG